MGEQEYKTMFGKSREEAVAETRSELRDAIKAKDKSKVRKLIEKLKAVFIGDDIFRANEVAANMMVAIVMLMMAVVIIVTLILALTYVYNVEIKDILPLSVFNIVMLIGVSVLCFAFKGEKSWLKYLEVFAVCITVMGMSLLLGYRTTMIIALPVVLSIRYFNEKLTRLITIVTGCMIVTSTIGFVFWGVSYDLNFVQVPTGAIIHVGASLKDAVAAIAEYISTSAYLKSILLRSALPNLLQFVIVAQVSVQIAKWGHRTIVEQASVAKEFSRLDTELTLANTIQADMLPNIFPAFPDRPEIDIYATMKPAKEVGGDFYDFFLIDNDHLGIVMADVSGKGVPAALFMMIGKTLIKNQAQNGLGPADILTKVNQQLCEHNKEQLFITAWVGILDIRTGELRAANAGHEFPAIKRVDGKYEFFKDKHGFVLAGMEFTRYKEYEIKLEKGDCIFTYTDGVTEATNEQNLLFGMDRTLDALNSYEGNDQEALLKTVHDKLAEFVGKAEQFDDITMLGVRYIGPVAEKETDIDLPGEHITLRADLSSIEKLTEWVDEELEKAECGMKAQMQIDVAVDEIFSNIARYAYDDGGEATVCFEALPDDGAVKLTFIDSGKPYNPLEKEDPDVTKTAEERTEGGLGIFIVKKTMDDVAYEYVDGKNILTIKKKI